MLFIPLDKFRKIEVFFFNLWLIHFQEMLGAPVLHLVEGRAFCRVL